MRSRTASRTLLHSLIVALSAAFLSGCASTPDDATPSTRTQVTFQVQLKSAINPAHYYYILLDTDNDGTDGPVPVVGRPWGNGYAAGSYTHYILYHGGTFGVYRSADADHTENVFLGRPLQASVTTTNVTNDTLQAQLDVSQVNAVNPKVRALDVNIVTTDRVPLDPQDPTPKVVDGLGSSGNDYVTIPLDFTTSYANGVDPDPGHPERAEAWVTVAALDMVNWRMVVQTNG